MTPEKPRHDGEWVLVPKAAWGFVTTVLERFRKDFAEGFHTRDKQYAVDLLGKAVEMQAAMPAYPASPALGTQEGERPKMKLHFTAEQMRRAIENDPDEAEYEAGPSHPEAPLPRFFVDHGVIHDRATGRHVRTCDCMGPFDDGIEAACGLLNSLADNSASQARTIEALRAALNEIGGGVEASTWKAAYEKLQEIARRALKERPNG